MADGSQSTLAPAKVWFWVVTFLHVIPFWFIYVNIVPTTRRWNVIHRLRAPDANAFDRLDDHRVDECPSVLDRKPELLPVAFLGLCGGFAAR